MDTPEPDPRIGPTFYDDPGPAIQAAAERHLEQVWEAFYQEEESSPDDDAEKEEISSPAVAPFCGCGTCEAREILAGAWPLIEIFFAGKPASS